MPAGADSGGSSLVPTPRSLYLHLRLQPPALHRRRQPHAAASSRRYANQGSPTPAPQQLPAAIDADSSSRSSLPQLPPATRRKPPSRRLCPASLLPQPPPSSPAAAVRNNFAAAFSLQIRPAATEESKLKGAGFRCTHCGWRIRRLFIQYSPGNIRLMKCDNCKAVADPYIECEFMIIFIDLILHKTKAVLHQFVCCPFEDASVCVCECVCVCVCVLPV
ncbi:hypothetical protein KSP39_PZI018142 [Platanthera zijinensis]|uniref:Protein ARV n=1 Tax=Platanthera zijinensis TaxID=2320716 RepID=A0AAP0B3Z7_9ASPA